MATKLIQQNKRARFDYEILSTIEAGISLTGPEIKSIRQGDVSIQEAFILIRHEEVFLLNMYIKPYKFTTNTSVGEPDRIRKLLLHKKEIRRLDKQVQTDGVSLVPLKLYWKDNHVKLELGVGKGKKNYDKRQTIKARDLDRKLKKNKY